jgi:hypothetical protein
MIIDESAARRVSNREAACCGTVAHPDRRLRGFGRPVLLVTGTGTAPFLRRIHDTLAREIPGARTAEMPAGHAPQIVSMDRFLGEVAAFQAAIDRAPRMPPDLRRSRLVPTRVGNDPRGVDPPSPDEG